MSGKSKKKNTKQTKEEEAEKAVEDFKKGTPKKQTGGITNEVSKGKRNGIFGSGNSGPQNH